MHIQPDHPPYDPGPFSPWIPAAGRGETNAGTPATAIAAETNFSGLVNVTTAEGDKVTLNLAVETDYRYAHAGTRFPVGAATPSAQEAAETSVARSLGVTVEGNLSDQELADLAKLLQSITGIFRKYLQGQDEQAAARTARLAERFESLSLLSKVDLSLEMTRTLAVVQAVQDSLPTVPATAGAEDRAAVAAPAGRNWPGAPLLTPQLVSFLPQVIRRAVNDLGREADTDGQRERLEGLRRGVGRALGDGESSRPVAAVTGAYAAKEPAEPEFSQVV